MELSVSCRARSRSVQSANADRINQRMQQPLTPWAPLPERASRPANTPLEQLCSHQRQPKAVQCFCGPHVHFAQPVCALPMLPNPPCCPLCANESAICKFKQEAKKYEELAGGFSECERVLGAPRASVGGAADCWLGLLPTDLAHLLVVYLIGNEKKARQSIKSWLAARKLGAVTLSWLYDGSDQLPCQRSRIDRRPGLPTGYGEPSVVCFCVESGSFF